MLNFIIKTHRNDCHYNGTTIFILNKGMNSGRPSKEPCTNCFVLIFQNEEDVNNIYFVAYSLWKVKFWHQHLVGSVIPFLRLPDFKREFFSKSKMMMQEHQEHLKYIAALKLLEQQETQFHKNINLINEMRRVILHNYCK